MKFHDELNEKLWNKEGEEYSLKPEVADKLNEIADAFITFLDIPEDSIEDIVITGSSANYNYNQYSDLDLHLRVDFEKIHEDCPLVEGYLWAFKQQFNTEHDISIYGVPVELYAENKDEQAVSNGVYSLTSNEWLKVPEKIEPTDNDAAVESKYKELKEAIERVDDSEEAGKLLEKIYKMRRAGLAEVGEFSTENLAFKKLRNEKLLDKLREIKKADIDKQLTLESFNEEEEIDTNKIMTINKQLTPLVKDMDLKVTKIDVKKLNDTLSEIITSTQSGGRENAIRKATNKLLKPIKDVVVNSNPTISQANKVYKDIKGDNE